LYTKRFINEASFLFNFLISKFLNFLNISSKINKICQKKFIARDEPPRSNLSTFKEKKKKRTQIKLPNSFVFIMSKDLPEPFEKQKNYVYLECVFFSLFFFFKYIPNFDPNFEHIGNLGNMLGM